MVGYIGKLPHAITVIAKDMWKGIKDAFIEVLNGIIKIWNDTLGKLNVKIPKFIPGIGGKSFGLPKIPEIKSADTGGLMGSDGLIYAHAGELIVPPAGSKFGNGPLVHIENVNSNVDVELLAQRVSAILAGARI